MKNKAELSIEQIKEFVTIGELKQRVKEIESYNNQIQADEDLTNILSRLRIQKKHTKLLEEINNGRN